MTPEIKRFPTLKECNRQIALFIADAAEVAVDQRGVFTLVLSGGSTPRSLYEHLASQPFADRLPWHNIHVFWGDERCTSPAHAGSNFAMAYDTLLSKVDLPAENIHRMPAELEPPQAGAAAYEKLLRIFFHATPRGTIRTSEPCRIPPRFDLILLGMGPDGHTASLFPGAETLEEKKKWVAATTKPTGTPAVNRITLTLPIINNARYVIFLISGPKKEKLLNSMWNNDMRRPYPAAMIKPTGRLLWFLAHK